MERQGGIAIWRQIADQMRGEITAGRFGSGMRLPPEVALAERFGVNRHTVRSAIAALTQEGVLRAEQGRGTFVADARRLKYPIGRRTRFSEGLASQTRETKSILLEERIETAHGEVAEALNLGAGVDDVIRLETVSTADGRPVSRATSWFVRAQAPDIAADYATSGSITAALKAAGIDDYFRRSTIISAYHADAGDLRHLKLAPGAIVLMAKAINVDREGNPVEFAMTRFAADRMELSIDNPR
ncbi:MAG: phosphonate metabolism transcriptional regulator PhnF [Phyllobacterium sp.]